VHHQHKRPTRNACDERNIADEIEAELVVQSCVECIRRAAEQKRIAVGRRTRDSLRAERAASTATVLDDEWLAEPFDSDLPIRRERMSVALPGAKPTMMRTGRLG
jgi:hypothetical protein